MYIRIQCHDKKKIKKNACCKSELSKIVHSVLARCCVCRKTSISQLFFFSQGERQLFWLPRDSAAELVSAGRQQKEMVAC